MNLERVTIVTFVYTGDGHKRRRRRRRWRRRAARGAAVGAAHAQGHGGRGGGAAPLLTLHVAPRLTRAQSLVKPATHPRAASRRAPTTLQSAKVFKRFGRKDVFKVSTVTYQSLERCDMMGLKNLLLRFSLSWILCLLTFAKY